MDGLYDRAVFRLHFSMGGLVTRLKSGDLRPKRSTPTIKCSFCTEIRTQLFTLKHQVTLQRLDRRYFCFNQTYDFVLHLRKVELNLDSLSWFSQPFSFWFNKIFLQSSLSSAQNKTFWINLKHRKIELLNFLEARVARMMLHVLKVGLAFDGDGLGGFDDHFRHRRRRRHRDDVLGDRRRRHRRGRRANFSHSRPSNL